MGNDQRFSRILLLTLTACLLLSDDARAEKCPTIAQLKSRKLPINWNMIEPEIMNAEEFEEVVIERSRVICHYSSVFDKEIAVALKGKKQPINPFSWRVGRGKVSASCYKGIDSCGFMKYDQETLDAIIRIVEDARIADLEQRKADKQKEKEAASAKESGSSVPVETAGVETEELTEEAKPASKSGVKVF